MSRARFAQLFLLLAACVTLAQAATVPEPRGRRVVDEAGVLSSAEVADLEGLIGGIDRETRAEIGILIAPDLTDENPKQYATRVFKTWGIGKKDRDNGLLILVSINPRRIEVETGYGVEGALPDVKVARFVREQARPELKQNHYGAGLRALVKALGDELKRPANLESPRVSQTPAYFWLVIKIAPACFTALLLLAIFGSASLVLAWPLYFGTIVPAALAVNCFNPAVSTFAYLLAIIATLPTLLLVLIYKNRCPSCGRPLGKKQRVISRACTAKSDGFETVYRECSQGHRTTYYDVPLARIDSPMCPACGKNWHAKGIARSQAPTYYSGGFEEWARTCAACGFVTSAMVTLAQLREVLSSSGGGSDSGGGGGSSSSGGGSFGGGSSGGGGSGSDY